MTANVLYGSNSACGGLALQWNTVERRGTSIGVLGARKVEAEWYRDGPLPDTGDAANGRQNLAFPFSVCK